LMVAQKRQQVLNFPEKVDTVKSKLLIS